MQKLIPFILLLVITWPGHTQKIENLIKKGDLDAIRKMEAKGADIYSEFNYAYYHEDTDKPGWDELYPMAYAAGVNDSAIVAFYIGKRSAMEDLGIWEAAISQAFTISLSTGNQELMRRLYELGPDINTICNSCRSHNAIMLAVAYDLEEWYFKLKPASDLQLHSDQGNSLLHLACLSSSHAIFEDVLGSGLYDLNMMNMEGMTPLDIAAYTNNPDYFFHLIEQGADPQQAEMLWMSVAWSGNMQLLEFMVDHASPVQMFRANDDLDTPLHIAIMENHSEMTIALTDLMIAYGDSVHYIFVDSYAFASNDIHPLSWAINHANKSTYEAFLRFADKANTSTGDPSYVPVYTFLYKPAVKVFGREYVDGLYEKYRVEPVKKS